MEAVDRFMEKLLRTDSVLNVSVTLQDRENKDSDFVVSVVDERWGTARTFTSNLLRDALWRASKGIVG